MGGYSVVFNAELVAANGLDPRRGSLRETLLDMTGLNQRLESSYGDGLGR